MTDERKRCQICGTSAPLFFMGRLDGMNVYACQEHVNEVDVDDEDDDEDDDE